MHKIGIWNPNKLSQSQPIGWGEGGDIVDGRLDACRVLLWDNKGSTYLSPSSFCNRFFTLLSAKHKIQGTHLLGLIFLILSLPYLILSLSPDILIIEVLDQIKWDMCLDLSCHGCWIKIVLFSLAISNSSFFFLLLFLSFSFSFLLPKKYSKCKHLLFWTQKNSSSAGSAW